MPEREEIKKLAELLKQLDTTEQLAVLNIITNAQQLASKRTAIRRPCS